MKAVDSNEIKRELARREHLRFIQHNWRSGDFIVGFHTRKICEAIDRAIEKFKQGESSYIRIAVHPRAGKSVIVSCFLPINFISQFPESEVIQISHSKHLSVDFARFGRELFKEESYQELYPNIQLSDSSSASDNWRILKDGKETGGRVSAFGINSGILGKGYHLGIVDDYHATFIEANSALIRDKTWTAFTDDFLQRAAPVSITIVLATQAHEDDIHGRIERKNDKNSKDYDENWPTFETYKFPARSKDYEKMTGESYPNEFLFEERFSKEYYFQRYSILDAFSASCLFDCSPIPASGSLIDVDNIIFHENFSEFPENLEWVRVWDIAHTAKEITGNDPDFTGGTLLGARKIGFDEFLREEMFEFWIKDYQQFREAPIKRDEKIKEIIKKDGPNVKILIEQSLDSRDMIAYMQQKLGALRKVVPVFCKGDKVQRLTPISGLFEHGKIHALRGHFNSEWLDGLRRFDGTGKSHDEMVDNLTCAFIYFKSYKAVKSFVWGR